MPYKCLNINHIRCDVHFQGSKHPAPAKHVESPWIGGSPLREVAQPMGIPAFPASSNTENVSAHLLATQYQPAAQSVPKEKDGLLKKTLNAIKLLIKSDHEKLPKTDVNEVL